MSENVSHEELSDYAKEQIAKANQEAAKYRVEKKDAVEAARAEVITEYEKKLEEAVAVTHEVEMQVSRSRGEVERLKAAIGAGIPTDKVLTFADLLKGENEDELRSHAEELKKLFGETGDSSSSKSKVTDPSQGTGGDVTPLNGDQLLNDLIRFVGK